MKILSPKNIIWNTTKIVGSLNFSIILFLLIALISILGTIIEQDQSLFYYQTNYPIKDIFFSWQTIVFFGLDHVYATWWFLSILFLFFLSLMVCTFSRQLPGLNNARNWKFLSPKNNKKKLVDFKSFYNKSLPNMVYSLHSRHYYVFHKGNGLYAYKGLLGRIAPIFVHISIICTLIGAMIGLFRGFVAQEMVPNGEIFHLNNIIKSGSQSKLPQNLIGYIQDFSIEYNSDGSIKQFFSDVSLLNSKGENLITKQISVNSPLVFKGITFYQTDWQINSLRFQIGNAQIMQKQLKTLKVGNRSIWVCSLPLLDQTINLVMTGLQNQVLIYDSKGQLTQACNINSKIQIQDTSFVIKEVMTSTGLQIKVDPGVSVVYCGFLILMISIITSYLSYSQIWVKSIDDNIDLAGSTNRAALAFEEDFAAIQQTYANYTFRNFIR